MTEEMKIQMVPIDKIIPYVRNPRKNRDAIDFVASSIKEFGFKQPIVVDKDYVIVAGHTRYEASKKLELTEVPILVANDLTPQQIKAYRIADNKIATYSTFDDELLVLEFQELKTDGYDLINTAFSENELNFLMETSGFVSDYQPDTLPESTLFGTTKAKDYFALVYSNEEEKQFWIKKLGIDGHKRIWNPDELGFFNEGEPICEQEAE